MEFAVITIAILVHYGAALQPAAANFQMGKQVRTVAQLVKYGEFGSKVPNQHTQCGKQYSQPEIVPFFK